MRICQDYHDFDFECDSCLKHLEETLAKDEMLEAMVEEVEGVEYKVMISNGVSSPCEKHEYETISIRKCRCCNTYTLPLDEDIYDPLV